MHPGLLLTAIVTGLATGALYAMVGLGYTVVYNATRVFNLAQGDLVMASVMLSYLCLDVWHWPELAAFALSILGPVVLALVEERVIVRPLLRFGHGSISWLIATLAFSLVIETVAARLYGNHAPQGIPSPIGNHAIRVGPVTLSTHYLLVVAALAVVLVGVEVFYGRTWTGRAMRATAEDREAAAVFGIEPGRLGSIAFGLGGLVAGIAGFVIAPIVFSDTTIGLNFSLLGFLALAIGGFGSLRGAVVGGLLVGVGESVWDLYVGSQVDILAGLCLLAIVLIVRPVGLFAPRAERLV